VPPGTPDAVMAQTGTEKKKKWCLRNVTEPLNIYLTVPQIILHYFSQSELNNHSIRKLVC